jgi:hypothetical protein
MATVPDVPVVSQERVACYCCGESVDDSNVVRFDQHPRDGVCIGCAAWLHKRSLAIGHEIRPPFWRRFVPGHR